MAVLMIIEMNGMTPEVYDAMNETMGFPGEAPDGLISHTAGQADGGMRIVDVWESREHHGRFVEEKLGPAMGQVEGGHAVETPGPQYFSLHYRWSA